MLDSWRIEVPVAVVLLRTVTLKNGAVLSWEDHRRHPNTVCGGDYLFKNSQGFLQFLVTQLFPFLHQTDIARSLGGRNQNQECRFGFSSSRKHNLLFIMSLDADNIFKIRNHKNRGMEGYVLVEETSPGTDISYMVCRLCCFQVYAPYYRRDKDKYLHIACAHLPTEMEHELHPGCTLHLRTRGGEERVCNLCSSTDGCHALYFNCDCGEFVVDARCAFKLFPITYKFHHHPLIPILNVRESFYCVACKRDDSGFSSYECTTCSFRVHQNCVSGRIVKLPSHHHDLKLIYSIPGNSSGEPICCQICQEDMKDANYAFHCARCRYFFHIYSCRSIEHPSGRYPLMLIEEGDNAVSASENCHGCQLMTSVMYYTGSRQYYFSFGSHQYYDYFYLHKFCAELPQTIEHHLHPEHALILSAEYYGEEFMCNACHRPWTRFRYYCAHQSCRFTIDIACAMKTLYLKREFHQHKLLSTHRSPSYPCRACDRTSDGPAFECATCRFCVHQQCASAPMFKKYDLHPHKLKLTYLLQSSLKDDRKEVYCRICRKSIELHNWAYHCAGCRYYTHVHRCSNPREIEGFDYEAALAAAIRLPVADEFVSFATLFLMDTNSKEEENEPQDTVGKKSRRMLFLEEDIETCHEFVQFPAAPCNNCALCEYVLPRSPSELWGPSSSLLKGYYLLRDTKEHCNGFDMCSFGNISNMKINGTVLPRYVKHEGHKHVLSTTFVSDKATWCDACENWFKGYGFRCNICQYTIDTYCALLPGSVSHSYDKEHGFKLTYYSIEGVDEYVCEICEGDITTMWFYHCVKCDHSIHARCIWKHHVKFGPFVKFDEHEHEFTVVPINKTTSFRCYVCDNNKTSGCRYCLSCEHCYNVNVDLECISNLRSILRLWGHLHP